MFKVTELDRDSTQVAARQSPSSGHCARAMAVITGKLPTCPSISCKKTRWTAGPVGFPAALQDSAFSEASMLGAWRGRQPRCERPETPQLSSLGRTVALWPGAWSLSQSSCPPSHPPPLGCCHSNRSSISKGSPSIIWASDLRQGWNEGTVC